MKKITCTLFLSFLLSGQLLAQMAITPNSAYRSQTLSTTITGPYFFLSFGSAPQSSSDIWLRRFSTYIYANSFSIIDNSTLHANFTIPFNAPAGAYSVNLAESSWVFDFLNNGFSVIGSYIMGHVYNDVNSNGVQDVGEFKLSGRRILVQPGNHIVFTDMNGNYSFDLPVGNYTAEYSPDTSWALTSSPAIYNINTTATSSSGNNFGVHATNPWYSVSTLLGLEGTPRCNSVRTYTVVIQNTGTAVQNGTVVFTKASQLSFISASPTPTSISGNDYTWDYTNLQPSAYMSFSVTVNIPFIPNTTIVNSAFTTARDLIGNVVDTSGYILTQMVLCSFDPNDKAVEPSGSQSTQHYTPIYGEYFYTIRFQNTGNDTAFSVNIFDTLDISLDLSTFALAGSSHYCETHLEPNRVMRFYFPNINLPDSNTNEVTSHGFVSFRIYPNFGLPDFTVVTNTAAIVFDQNPPIITNTVFNTLISFPTGVPGNVSGEGEVTLYPNPVTTESVLIINQKGNHDYELRIYDSTGKLVKTATFSSNHYVLQRKDFVPGIYLYQVKEINGTFSKSGKLMIE